MNQRKRIINGKKNKVSKSPNVSVVSNLVSVHEVKKKDKKVSSEKVRCH